MSTNKRVDSARIRTNLAFVRKQLNALPVSILILAVIAGSAIAADFAQDYNTAIYYYKRGEYELAARSFESLIQRFPGDSRLAAAIFWCGKSHEKSGHPDAALEQYQSLIDRFPESQYQTDALYSAAQSAMRADKHAQALMLFGTFIEDGLADTAQLMNARIGMAECRLQMGDDVQAEAALRALINTPSVSREQKHLAAIRLKLLADRRPPSGGPLRPIPLISRTPELSPVEDYLLRGQSAYTARKFAESRQCFEEIYRRSNLPGDILAYALYYGGRASLELGDLDKGRNLLERASRTSGALPDVRGGAALYLASVYRTEGKPREVEKMAASGERIAQKTGQPVLRDDMLYFRAESAYQNRQYDQALDHLTHMASDDFRVRRLRGMVRMEKGDYDAAADDLEQALQAAQNDNARNEVLADRARVRFLQKKYAEALAEIGRLSNPSSDLQASLRPIHAESLYQLSRYRDAAAEYGRLADETADQRPARRYRYLAALAAFKDKNETWADKLLEALAAVGGVPENGEIEPAVFLDRAMRIDQAITFASPAKPQKLQSDLDALLQGVHDTALCAFTMDRLRARDIYAILPAYSRIILESEPPSSDLYGRAATFQMWACEKMGDRAGVDESRQILENWSALRPGSALSEDVLYEKAKSLQESGNRLETLKALHAYEKQFPEGKFIREVCYAIGNLSLDEKLEDEADAAFTEFLRRTPKTASADVSVNRVRRSMGDMRLRQNRPAEAVEFLEPLASADPYKSDPGFLLTLAQAFLAAGRPQQAESQFRAVIDHPRATADQIETAVDALFTVLYRSKQISVLESEFRKWSDRIRDPARRSHSNYQLASLLYGAGRFVEAEPYYEGVTDPPGAEIVVESHMRLADCEFQLKKFQSARDKYAAVPADYPQSKWADEANLEMGICKIRMGIPEDALDGFEKFLKQNPNSPVAARMAIESARLYVHAEDLEAATRSLDLYDRRTPADQQEESMRMRMAIDKKRDMNRQLVDVAKTFHKTFGFRTDVSIDAAVSATRLQDVYDPFGLKSSDDLQAVLKTFESCLSDGRQPVRTFAIDVKFDVGGKYLGTENPVICAIKRIILGESRVALVIESKLSTMMNTSLSIRINRVTVSGEDIRTIPDGFISGIQLGGDFSIKYPQLRYFVVSVPRDRWADKAVIGLDLEVGGYKSEMFARLVKPAE